MVERDTVNILIDVRFILGAKQLLCIYIEFFFNCYCYNYYSYYNNIYYSYC